MLFGAGEGTTIGSFAPRVQSFLASLAPDIGQGKNQSQIAIADRPAPDVHSLNADPADVPHDENWKSASNWPSTPWAPATLASTFHSG